MRALIIACAQRPIWAGCVYPTSTNQARTRVWVWGLSLLRSLSERFELEASGFFTNPPWMSFFGLGFRGLRFRDLRFRGLLFGILQSRGLRFKGLGVLGFRG